MDIRLNASNLPVASNTEPKKHTNSSRPLTISVGPSIRELKEVTLDSPISPKRAKRLALNPAETCHPEENIHARSVIRLETFLYSKTNNLNKMNPWCTYFKCIYQSLEENKHLEIKAQLNALSDVQIKSLLIDRTPGPFAEFQKPIPLLELASTSREAGNIFFRISFDRLSSEELRVALLESGDSNQTLLQHACCVMDEPLFKQLEQKLGMQTLLEMITRPVNDLDSPLAFACLYNKSTYLFDTVIHQDRELIEKLLKGSPDIDQSLLQFMCNDAAMRCRLLSDDEYHHRIKYLLNALSKQDHFEAVRFTGKSNESALLWACTKSFDDFDDLATILTESLDDAQIAELCTAEAETGNSLVQKCLELDRTNKVAKLCMSIRDPLLRLKVLSICTSEGHSFFQQWLLKPFNNPIKYTEYLLQDMDDSHRDLLIAGDRSIWDQINTSTNHTLRQQEQTPIVNVMNRKEMRLANFLWEQIADPELQIKLLLYKTRHQTTLLQHLLDLDNEAQWQYFKNRLRNTHSLNLSNSFAAELYTHAIAAGRFEDAGYYFSQISDSKLKYDLFVHNHKYCLLNLCKKRETITESFFSGQTPSQCTESVVYILEHSLYDQKPLMANLLQLITLQEKAGNKEAFVQWATSPRQGKQCPLTTVLSRFAIAYRKINNPECFPRGIGNRKHIEKEVSLNKQIFQGMISMMSEEQIKEFFLSLQDKSYHTLHLLGYEDILATIVDTLGDSGRAFLEQINPANGGNLLHILFESSFIDNTDIELNDLIKTVDWLDKTYGLTPFLQSRLENDGSTPLHVLLATATRAMRRYGNITPKVQKHILKQLCQPNADGILLAELLKLKDNNGCTPLHKFFSCMESNGEIGDLLFQELGLETCFKLMHIKDKQGNTVMSHCSKLHDRLNKEYNSRFQTLSDGVKGQES